MVSVVAIVISITQILMALLNGPLENVAGKYKLLLVTFLSLVLAVASGISTGMDLGTALFTGAGLAALQVFGNQVWKQFFAKEV